MAKRASIGKNLGLQTAYQILNTCLPLITAPYLARVLGASQLGVYSFTASVMSYFMLLAMLGTANHGTRSIAACGDDAEKRSKTFWSIYLMQAANSLLCTLAYVVYLLLFCRENRLIAAIQTIEVFSCALNIGWLFFGVEQFKTTVGRNVIVRVTSVILILLLVKKPEDLWIYALIMVMSALCSQLVLWTAAPKLIGRARVSFSDCRAQFKPSLMLFLPLLAMSVYHIMDKTMLGMLSTYEQSGYYYNADKIVNVTVGVISGVSTVMLPRMSALIGQGQREEADGLFRTSLEGTVLAGTALSCGIAAIAPEFTPLFFGPGYDACVLLTIVLAPVLIIKSFAFTARYQYLIPHHREKDYTASVVLGAVVNLAANAALIPRLGAMGAVIGTLLAELAACTYQFVVMRHSIPLRTTLLRCCVYLLLGAAMFVVVRLIARVFGSAWVKLALEISGGAVVYLGLCKLYWMVSKNDIESVFLGAFRRRRV